MLFKRTVILIGAALAACTPHLVGTCSGNGDCQAGESCSPDHICLRDDAATGGGTDAGNTDAGGTATIDMVAPAAGALVRGTFHVAAQASSAAHDVTFTATDPQSGAALGSLVVSSATQNTWSGELAIDQSTFGGPADVRAALHRTGLADVTSAKVTVTVDQNAPSISATWDAARWSALGAGIALTASVSDDRTGVVSADLVLPDGGSAPGTISGGVATFQIAAAVVGTPGLAVAVPVSLHAADGAGNQVLRPAASSIRIDDQPPSVSVEALDPAVWRTGSLDFTATVDDGAGSGTASVSLLSGGASVAGEPDAGGIYGFHADLSALPPTEGPLPMQVVAIDGVGNLADAGFTLNVDNVPPVVSAAAIDTAFDGFDTGNQGWFQGPTVAPSAGPVVVSAAISDANLVTTAAGAPAALVGATRYPGAFDPGSGRWTFSIPRGATDVLVTFDAQDLAGNHVDAPPGLTLRFDDVAFTASVASDSTWYGRSVSVSPAVGVTLSAAPRSGMNGLVLKVTGKADVACTGSGTSYSCALPSTYATAGQEAALGFSVAAAAGSAYATTASGSRNFDDLAPVVSNTAAVPYPAAGAGALSWGHDGAHFTLRDSATLFTFTAYDCGAGVSPAASSLSLSPAPSSKTISIADSGARHACANGVSAVVYNFTASANLSTTAAGSFAAVDNTLTLGASAVDGASGAPHTTGASKGVSVTRRLWTAGVHPSTAFLALGPMLFVSGSGGLFALNPATGAVQNWPTATVGTFIAPNGSTPAVIYSTGLDVTAGNAASFSLSTFGSCNVNRSSGPDDSSVITGYELSSASTVSIQSSTTACTAYNLSCCNADCGSCPCSGCCKTFATTNYQDQLTLSGSSVSCPAAGSAGPARCNGAPSPPAGLSTVVSSTGGLFIGASSLPIWVLANSGGTVLDTFPPGGSIVVGHGWPVIDGSGTVAYLPDSGGFGGFDAVTISGGHFSRLYNVSPPFPAVVSDMVLSNAGILFVLSGGNVFAIITDSASAQSAQASAWPSRCHDPCASSLAGFSCPY